MCVMFEGLKGQYGISHSTGEHPLFFRISVANPVQLPSLMRRVKIRRPLTRDGKVNGCFFPLQCYIKQSFQLLLDLSFSFLVMNLLPTENN
jgi:hypothetical protein